MQTKLNHLVCLLSFLPMFFLRAQIKNQGIPSITQYAPSDYQGDTQNWAILQDRNGLVYIGNNAGLLEYDGVRWKLLLMPNKSMVRSLAIDRDGTIYVGAQNELGFLRNNAFGEKEYVSLVPLLPEDARNFEGVPNVFCTAETVLFHTLKGLFVLDKSKQQFSFIAAPKSFQLAHWVNGSFYTNEESQGLLKLTDTQQLLPIEAATQFAKKRVECILPFSKDTLLIKTEDEKFVLLSHEKHVTYWKTEFDDFYTSIHIYGATFWDSPQGERYFLLGTLENGLLILNKRGQVIQHLHKGNGLRSNTVWATYLDHLGNVWLGLDDGLAYVALQSPFTSFALEGLVLTSKLFQGYLYVGTTQGLFYKKWQDYENPLDQQQQFQWMEGTKEQAWNLQEIDGSLFCAHIKGVFEIRGTKARKIADGYCWKIAPLWQHPHTFVVGTYQKGLWIFERQKNGEWGLKQQLPFAESARYVESDMKGNVWISHPFKGVYRLQLDSVLERITFLKHYTTEHGLPSINYNFVYSIGEEVIFSTERGMYRYDDKADNFYYDTHFNRLLETQQQVRRFSVGANNQVWYATKEQIGAFVRNKYQKYQSWQPPLNSFRHQVVYHINPVDEKNVLIGLPNRLVHFDHFIGKTYFESSIATFKTLIRAINAIGDDTKTLLQSGAEQRLRLSTPIPYQTNHLKFSFASNWYESSAQNLYSCYLEGYDKAYGEWTFLSEKEYTNLPEGNYVFYVRCQNIHGNISQEASVAFTIEPPYYRTTVAYVFYLVAAIFLVIGISYANSQRIRLEKARLEELVRQRTNELSERNQEIEQQNQMLAQQKEEILRQNENIQRQNETLRQLNEEKNHLIGILAHDLRNPLHQIKMLILLIRMQSKDRFTNDDEKYLALMEKSCDHLNDMITKILDIEAIESQKVKLKLETVHVGNFLRMMVDSFQGMAAKKNIRLQAAFDENFD
ncbi:MAG: triple tyrosine motif-containing protein, partial [Flammeovirgaceae bacterium]|nr:triple tyrosine motif-containing protein [Flammeovirgaceae bacterium]